MVSLATLRPASVLWKLSEMMTVLLESSPRNIRRPIGPAQHCHLLSTVLIFTGLDVREVYGALLVRVVQLVLAGADVDRHLHVRVGLEHFPSTWA